jgi:hypothetical protein
MSLENPLWGAPRIHGELLKLGFAVFAVDRRQVRGQAVASKRFAHRAGPLPHLALPGIERHCCVSVFSLRNTGTSKTLQLVHLGTLIISFRLFKTRANPPAKRHTGSNY